MTAARLSIDAATLDHLLRELAARGQGTRESGAFLLTEKTNPASALPQPVTAVAFYDDLDPHCLTGRIEFGAAGYSALNELCRRGERRVVGDIHTHPYRGVRQSGIDADHPMVALDGHVAVIAPYFAVGVTDVEQLGVDVRHDGGWISFYGRQAADVITVHPTVPRPSRWRRLLMRRRNGRTEERS